MLSILRITAKGTHIFFSSFIGLVGIVCSWLGLCLVNVWMSWAELSWAEREKVDSIDRNMKYGPHICWFICTLALFYHLFCKHFDENIYRATTFHSTHFQSVHTCKVENGLFMYSSANFSFVLLFVCAFSFSSARYIFRWCSLSEKSNVNEFFRFGIYGKV